MTERGIPNIGTGKRAPNIDTEKRSTLAEIRIARERHRGQHLPATEVKRRELFLPSPEAKVCLTRSTGCQI